MSAAAPPVPTCVLENLPSTFGNSEMEGAALVILRKVVRYRTWDIVVTIEDFLLLENGRYYAPDRHLDHYDIDGFLNLLLHGWLGPNTQNPSAHGEFFLTENFITRVVRTLRVQGVTFRATVQGEE